MIERSDAFRCPSIYHQLAGLKKIQTLLGNREIFNRFVPEPESELAQSLYNTFMRFWPVNEDTLRMVEADCSQFVLKSNLEGGGNNFFGDQIAPKMRDII